MKREPSGRLTPRGVLREVYFQPEPIAVTLVFEATDKAAVEQRLTQFPTVAGGLLDVQLIELGYWEPLQACSGKESLIDPADTTNSVTQVDKLNAWREIA